MRYRACTSADIEFLHSHVISLNPELPKLSRDGLKNVSIITPLNIEKDRINERGCKHFAEDTKQELTHFYSVDSGPAGVNLPVGLQKEIWSLPPSDTDHVPGKLSLCIGMPVLIRYNYCTELCVTRGQEACMVDWKESTGPFGQRILDVLFVQLCNAPRIVKIGNLPDNIVPIVKHANKLTLKLLRLDKAISILRQQVHVLPNFAMTDYSSQGKNRDTNVVETASEGVLWQPSESIALQAPTRRRKKEKCKTNKDRVTEIPTLHYIISVRPVGPRWDHKDWNCAYDSFIAIVYNTWLEN